MAVKIRLSRIGKKNAPVFRIVAIDSRSARDGAPLEVLGTYNPVKHELVQFNADRINYWISTGAQVSNSVKKIQKLHSTTALSATP
jgi:small subunit ribosomal protein S16